MISFLSRIIDLIAPKSCIICGHRTAVGEDIICTPCNMHLPRTGFVDNPQDNEMAMLFWGQLPVERSAALFYYKSHSQVSRTIYKLKYYDRPDIGISLGQITAAEFLPKGFFEGIDIIVPVPLAPNRRRTRGYNQSMEIARGVSRVTGLPVSEDVVKRTKFKDSQARKDRWQRAENVEHSFTLLKPDVIKGKHILIIDDVVTTGATVNALGRELSKAGDIKISVLSAGFTRT